MRIYKFYKEDGCWYIDLPEYIESGIGTQGDLQMVAGADTWLDILSNGRNEVNIRFETDPFVGYTHSLTIIPEVFPGIVTKSGAYYEIDGHSPLTLWLCEVIQWVFKGGYPKRIFYKVINPPTVYESRSTTQAHRS